MLSQRARDRRVQRLSNMGWAVLMSGVWVWMIWFFTGPLR